MANLTWTTPSGQVTVLSNHILKQAHTLIAGTTGSGKSVMVSNLIRAIMFRFPQNMPGGAELILIDPKRVELAQYKPLPHTFLYASEPEEMYLALQGALTLVELRFKDMQARGERLYTGSDVYIIIDELADLLTTDKKRILPILQRIGQIGRAARVHLICCTQCPTAQILSTQLKVNFDSILALRTRSAQDSRNIIGISGAEKLPKYGKGIYQSPEEMHPWEVSIPLYDDIPGLIEWWLAQVREHESHKLTNFYNNNIQPVKRNIRDALFKVAGFAVAGLVIFEALF